MFNTEKILASLKNFRNIDINNISEILKKVNMSQGFISTALGKKNFISYTETSVEEIETKLKERLHELNLGLEHLELEDRFHNFEDKKEEIHQVKKALELIPLLKDAYKAKRLSDIIDKDNLSDDEEEELNMLLNNFC